MKSKIWIILATLTLQLLLTLTPFFPWTRGLWNHNEPSVLFSTLAGFIGVHLILVSSSLTIILTKETHQVKQAVETASLKLPPVLVRRLPGHEFYRHFRSALEVAEHSARIAYLAPYPPADVRYKDRNKYYAEVIQLIKKRPNVNFKRIVRRSPKNDSWVADLLRELDGRPNVEIAVLERDLPPETEMPLALSVQVIDVRKVWLVAVSSHETQKDFRDVYIESEDVAAAMTDYYERLWAHATKVLDRGRITEEGRRLQSSV